MSNSNNSNSNATKLIYVKCNNSIECIELNVNTTSEDFKETLRAIAECGTNDILKLYNYRGNLLNITTKIEANSRKDPYRLEVVVKSLEKNLDLTHFINRIESLENKIFSCLPQVDLQSINNLQIKVDYLTNKLENVEHLSWLGLFKDTKFVNINNSISNDHSKKVRKGDQIREIYERFKIYSVSTVNNELREYLKKPTFDNWQFDDAEMLLLIQQMFIDLDFVTKFAINIQTLQEYLFEVYSNYNEVPFHNFHHAFTVTQMMYGLIWICDLTKYLEPLDIFSLLISALSHDLDHDGYNNQYQINAHTPLTMIYNDQSPLEMYHCAVAFSILNKQQCNILGSLNREMYKQFRQNVIECILATDMSHHTKILNEFNQIVSDFDFHSREHRLLLMKILMKAADISNESRPVKVSEAWLDCLLTEFFNQGDHEKLKGLPISPLMDREKVTKSSSQIGFISFVLLPLIRALAQIFPQLNTFLIEPIQESYNYYKTMDSKLKDFKI